MPNHFNEARARTIRDDVASSIPDVYRAWIPEFGGLMICAILQLFEGYNKRFQHASKECGCDMKFFVYFPPAADKGKVPVRACAQTHNCLHDHGDVLAACRGRDQNSPQLSGVLVRLLDEELMPRRQSTAAHDR